MNHIRNGVADHAKELIRIGQGVGDGVLRTNYDDGIGHVRPIAGSKRIFWLQRETNCAGGPRDCGRAASNLCFEPRRGLGTNHLDQIQIKQAAAGMGDAEVGSGVLTIAKIGVAYMKDFVLPGVASGEDHTAAVFIKGFQRVAGIGVVLQT